MGSVKVPPKFFGRSAAVRVTFMLQNTFTGLQKMVLEARKSDFLASNFCWYKQFLLYLYRYSRGQLYYGKTGVTSSLHITRGKILCKTYQSISQHTTSCTTGEKSRRAKREQLASYPRTSRIINGHIRAHSWSTAAGPRSTARPRIGGAS